MTEPRAGAPWRILVHSIEPGGMSGHSWHAASDRTFGGGGEDTSVEADGKVWHQRHIELPGTDFDELVIGQWLHLEQLDTGVWWLNIGGVRLIVHADVKGRPGRVSVEGPGRDERVKGCRYEVDGEPW